LPDDMVTFTKDTMKKPLDLINTSSKVAVCRINI
jgi:hypothetical protein